MAIPAKLGDAHVVCAALIDDRHTPTGATRHNVGGKLQEPFDAVAICRYADSNDGFYLIYCDAEWNVVTDTWHASIDDAKRQAEFEYGGISKMWRTP